MKLTELEAKGAKELKVTNKEAVAVNPYEKFIIGVGLNPEWIDFQEYNIYLPPFHCHESVQDGTYPIGRFKLIDQFLSDSEEWVDDDDIAILKKHVPEIKTRTVLVLSEPVVETEPKKYYENYDKRFKDLHASIDEQVKQVGWKDFYMAVLKYQDKANVNSNYKLNGNHK